MEDAPAPQLGLTAVLIFTAPGEICWSRARRKSVHSPHLLPTGHRQRGHVPNL